jgi:hypothetical protein
VYANNSASTPSVYLDKGSDAIGFGGFLAFTSTSIPLVGNSASSPCTLMTITADSIGTGSDRTISMDGNRAASGGSGVFFQFLPIAGCSPSSFSKILSSMKEVPGWGSSTAPYGGIVSSFLRGLKLHSSESGEVLSELKVFPGQPIKFKVRGYDGFDSFLYSNFEPITLAPKAVTASRSEEFDGLAFQFLSKPVDRVSMVNGESVFDLMIALVAPPSYSMAQVDRLLPGKSGSTAGAIRLTAITHPGVGMSIPVVFGSCLIATQGLSTKSNNGTSSKTGSDDGAAPPSYVLQSVAMESQYYTSDYNLYVCRQRPQVVVPPMAFIVLHLILYAVFLCVCVGFMVFIYLKRRTRVIKGQNPVIWYCKLVGVMLVGTSSMLAVTVSPSIRGCNVVQFLNVMGFSIMFMSLVVGMQILKKLFCNTKLAAVSIKPFINALKVICFSILSGSLPLALYLLSGRVLINPVKDDVYVNNGLVCTSSSTSLYYAMVGSCVVAYLVVCGVFQYYFNLLKKANVPSLFVNYTNSALMTRLFCVGYPFAVLVSLAANEVSSVKGLSDPYVPILLENIPLLLFCIYFVGDDIYGALTALSILKPKVQRKVGATVDELPLSPATGTVSRTKVEGDTNYTVNTHGEGDARERVSKRFDSTKRGEKDWLDPSMVVFEKTVSQGKKYPVNSEMWFMLLAASHKQEFQSLTTLSKTIQVSVKSHIRNLQVAEKLVDRHVLRAVTLLTEVHLMYGLEVVGREWAAFLPSQVHLPLTAPLIDYTAFQGAYARREASGYDHLITGRDFT